MKTAIETMLEMRLARARDEQDEQEKEREKLYEKARESIEKIQKELEPITKKYLIASTLEKPACQLVIVPIKPSGWKLKVSSSPHSDEQTFVTTARHDGYNRPPAILKYEGTLVCISEFILEWILHCEKYSYEYLRKENN